MNDSTARLSRRQLLRYGVAGSMAALAGCQGSDDGPPPDTETLTGDGTSTETAEPTGETTGTVTGTPTDVGTPTPTETPADGKLVDRFELAGNGSEPFRSWLRAGNPIVFEDGTRLLFQYNDYETAATQQWEDMLAQRHNIAGTLGTSDESIAGDLLVGGDGSGQQGRLLFGTFDTEQIITFLEDEGRSVTDEYRDYTVLDGGIAVGEKTVLVTPLYEEYLDTTAGDERRLDESDDSAGIVVDVLPGGVQMSVSRDPSREGLDVTGTTVTEVDSDGTYQRMVRTFVFKNESDASVDAAREFVSMADDDPLTSEHHRRVVMLEYVPS